MPSMRSRVMRCKLIRLTFAVALAGGPLLGLAQKYNEALIAREPWFGSAVITSMTIAPDGKHVASVGFSGPASAVFVMNLDTKVQRIVATPERDTRYLFGQIPLRVHWVANDLMVVDYNNRESISFDLSGRKVASLGQRFIGRVTQGTEFPDEVLEYTNIDEGEFRMINARSGDSRKFPIPLPGMPTNWAFDAAGRLRVVKMFEPSRAGAQSKVNAWYRESEAHDWRLLESWPITSTDAWFPLRALVEPNMIAVLSRRGRDTYAVFKYDTVKRQEVELMAGHPLEDIAHADGLDMPTFESVVTDGIRSQTHWFDQRWASLQASVDAAIPGRTNRLEGDKHGRVLVTSSGDVDPGRWFILDTRTSVLRQIGEVAPSIKPEKMRPMSTVTYVARDGLRVSGYLTRPEPGPVALEPLVVLIHGGPNTRDRWMWNEEVQMLAHAGYVVFQPQFRGSTGFGRRFEEAGFRQWGRAMQDDITDGVKYLIEQKIVDPGRICIQGSSYGGYAALWGVIKTPDLYKCGISFAGISDLVDFLNTTILDDSTPTSREVRKYRIGDPNIDRAMLDEVSPVKHASLVKVPLLIAHGEQDRRVLASQSEAMVRSLQAAGRPAIWLSLPREGHGLNWMGSRLRYYTEVLNFLHEHIGYRYPVPAPASAPPQ